MLIVFVPEKGGVKQQIMCMLDEADQAAPRMNAWMHYSCVVHELAISVHWGGGRTLISHCSVYLKKQNITNPFVLLP